MEPSTYIVFERRAQNPGEAVRADEVVVEPCGALSFYNHAQQRKVLVRSFAPGAWQELRKSEQA